MSDDRKLPTREQVQTWSDRVERGDLNLSWTDLELLLNAAEERERLATLIVENGRKCDTCGCLGVRPFEGHSCSSEYVVTLRTEIADLKAEVERLREVAAAAAIYRRLGTAEFEKSRENLDAALAKWKEMGRG